MNTDLDDRAGTAGDAIADFLEDTSSLSDPYPVYAELREVEPVHWSSRLGMWVVTGFPEAEACFRDNRFSRHEAGMRQFSWVAAEDDPPEVRRVVDAWLSTVLNMDPPDHTRLRRLISRAFTPRAVAGWKARTEELVAEILVDLEPGETFDFIPRIAYPIPEHVICDILGVPFADHDRWKEWSGGMNKAAIFKGRKDAGTQLPPDVRALAQASLTKWYDYFAELIEQRRDHLGDDMVSELIRAEDEGDRLTVDELIGTLTLLIGAGHETTANLIPNGLLALMRNPEQYAKLRADPELAAGTVEETLRYDGSARGQPRVALEDIALGGATISRGEMVMVSVNAANRDPRRFTEPETFDITRGDTGHLAFASGIHFCVGAALARMETEVAFRRIAELPHEFTLDSDALAYKATHGRMLTALPVRYGA